MRWLVGAALLVPVGLYPLFYFGGWFCPPSAGVVLPPAPDPPIDPNDLEAVAKYQDQLEEHQEIVAQIQSNFSSRLNTYREGVPLLEKGFTAMAALSESGLTQCQFDEAWLWLMEE